MIFEFNGNKPEKYLSLIKLSYGNNIINIWEQNIKSNNNIIKLNIHKKNYLVH